jgi:hypothetical protein
MTRLLLSGTQGSNAAISLQMQVSAFADMDERGLEVAAGIGGIPSPI